jgi:hypothetical protein
MAEETYQKFRQRLSGSTPNLSEITRQIEDEARILHESGYSKEASNLRQWARELRVKSSRALFDRP